MSIIDISPTISESLNVWPGDVAYQRSITLDFQTGGNLLLSSIQTSVHLGAHADAPNHYHPDGVGIGQRSLAPYLGPCQVIRTKQANGARLTPESLGSTAIRAPRVLLCTNSFPDPEHWNTDFQALSPELVHFLADAGVCLVGIDTPSVDPFDDKELLSHTAIYQRDLCILEGLVLAHVPEGCYFLAAQPLKLKDADAAPVRAVLLEGISCADQWGTFS